MYTRKRSLGKPAKYRGCPVRWEKRPSHGLWALSCSLDAVLVVDPMDHRIFALGCHKLGALSYTTSSTSISNV